MHANLLGLRRCGCGPRLLLNASAMRLVRVRLAGPVRRLARAAAVAHLPASGAQLAGGRRSAEVALPDDGEVIDGLLAAGLRGPPAEQRRLHCVGLHAVARLVAYGTRSVAVRNKAPAHAVVCHLGVYFRDELPQKRHSVRSVLLHALAVQVALRDSI